MKRIAVVEDNPDNLLLVEAILAGEYEIISFENGQEALEGLAGQDVDLILLDISLPGMDGVQVLHELRKMDAFKQTPILALTAHAMVGHREKYLEEGFDDYYSKPIVDMDEVPFWININQPSQVCREHLIHGHHPTENIIFGILLRRINAMNRNSVLFDRDIDVRRRCPA